MSTFTCHYSYYYLLFLDVNIVKSFVKENKIRPYLLKNPENLSINKIELETSINMGHEIFN